MMQTREFTLRVDFAPPVKQAPADASERLSHVEFTTAIRAAFSLQYPNGFETYPRSADLELVIRYQRGLRRSDSANIVGGIADQLERAGVYTSDSQVRRIDYEEERRSDGQDSYVVHVRSLAPTDIDHAEG